MVGQNVTKCIAKMDSWIYAAPCNVPKLNPMKIKTSILSDWFANYTCSNFHTDIVWYGGVVGKNVTDSMLFNFQVCRKAINAVARRRECMEIVNILPHHATISSWIGIKIWISIAWKLIAKYWRFYFHWIWFGDVVRGTHGAGHLLSRDTCSVFSIVRPP